MTKPEAKSLRILMVEDDPELGEGWRDVFTLLGHDLRLHIRGTEALADPAWLASCDAVVSDYYLPDMNGIDLLHRVRAIRADLPLLLLTGSREPEIVAAARQQLPGCRILHKPLNIDDLERTLAEMAVSRA